MSLVYRASLGETVTEESFRAALESRFAEEVQRALTVVGPHRDDLVIELDGRDLRSFGSRGQQRVMALTLRLAEVGPVTEAVGSTPVLLLDDALSELDPCTQTRVLAHVAQAGQVFLTSAELDHRSGCPATWWEVMGGRVHGRESLAVRGVA